MEIISYPEIYELSPPNKFEQFLYTATGDAECVTVSHWRNYSEGPNLNEPTN